MMSDVIKLNLLYKKIRDRWADYQNSDVKRCVSYFFVGRKFKLNKKFDVVLTLMDMVL
jgi:hypothetical protein